MAAFSFLFLLWAAICYSVCAADDLFEIPTRRDWGDTRPKNSFSRNRPRQTGNITSNLGQSLYWFGNFSVGDSGSLKLLIDTGSTDLLVNPGLYKPSSNEASYGKGNFTISYEGVNRAGFGFETLSGTVTRDKVTAGGLTVLNQPLGNITSYKYEDTAPLPYAIQGQGIIGFLGAGSSSFAPPAPSWFFNLCSQKSISECVLGLAYGTSGEGLTIIGKIANKLISGGLTTLPRINVPYHAYTVIGDVTINNTIVAKDQYIIMDVGTDNIQGPIGVTQKILNMLGYPSSLKVEAPSVFTGNLSVKVLTGYFPCNKPPMLGFSFPAQSKLNGTQKAKIFNVSPAVWDVFDHGNNNCTSILGGTNALDDPTYNTTAWLLGQPFFAGHYLNFDITSNTVGFGDLVDPSMMGTT